MARTSYDRSSFIPSEATKKTGNDDPLVGAEFIKDFDEALEGAPKDEPTDNPINTEPTAPIDSVVQNDEPNFIPDFTAENQQISQIEEEIENREDSGTDFSLLVKQIKKLEEIKTLIKRISHNENIKGKAQLTGRMDVVKVTNKYILKYNQELLNLQKELQALISADKFQRKFDAENRQISQIEEEIERREDLDIDFSWLVDQKKILEEIKNLIKRISSNEDIKEKAQLTGKMDVVKVTERHILKYNQELSALKAKLQSLNRSDKTALTRSAEMKNVKRTLSAFLDESKIDPQLHTLFTEDAVLIEDLQKGANLKDALVKLVSDKLLEAVDQLAVAGIKLDKHGEPKVGILSRVFTNKAINQKNDPAYKKYRMWVDLNKKINEGIQNKQEVSEYTGPRGFEDGFGSTPKESPETVDEALAIATVTPHTKGRPSLNTSGAGELTGGAVAIASVLAAVAPSLKMEKPQDIPVNASYTAVAPKVITEPAEGYLPYLREQSEDLNREYESEERVKGVKGTSIIEVARREAEPEEELNGSESAEVEKAIPKTPTKKIISTTRKPQTGKVQRNADSEPQPYSYGDEPVSMDEDKPNFHSLVDEIKKTPNTPNPDGYPYATAFKPKSRIIGPETVVKPAETLPPPDNDIEKIISLFPQVLLDSSGAETQKLSFASYVRELFSAGENLPDAIRKNLTKAIEETANRSRSHSTLSSAEQAKKVLKDLKNVEIKFSLGSRTGNAMRKFFK